MSSGEDKAAAEAVVGAVLVVGGGIAGVQASLDAAEAGYRVHLVESGPAIGGRMAQLDKTFPTNDCSMCILSPKLVECGRHKDIDILTNAELVGLEGSPGRFIARIRRRARYVDPAKCTGCGECEKVCPVRVPSHFEANQTVRGAISRPYPQAVPNVPTIDPASCLRLKHQKGCGLCERACLVKAIRFDDRDREETLDVGAVILAPGVELFDPRPLEPLGYGRFPNVVTSLEFERILSASGPTAGHLVRPSDHAAPRRVAWLQCVGSRNVNQCENGYCSAVCCMYAIKQAVIAKEHDRTGLDTSIFFMDMRTHGKDFERFSQRAENEQGVRFVRSRIHSVLEDPQTRGLRLRYADENAEVHEEPFDMVVLSVGFQVSEETRRLGRTTGIDLDRYGFCVTPPFEGVSTSRPGVFACGAFEGPKDIPESVMQASAAAARAGALLAPARHSLVEVREFPPERDVRGEPPRIGVFVCHCGINIGGVIDVAAVVAEARGFPSVVVAEESLYTCSQDSQEHIRNVIGERGLNRVVVASCTPRTHEAIFQQTLREAGLNPDLFEMANIRDQDSWVHAAEPALATVKAIDLVRMAVAKARYLRPLSRQVFDVTKTALVVGGGVAGLSAALNVAEQGFDVHVIEASEKLGGHARRCFRSLDGGDAQILVAGLADRVVRHPRITTHMSSTLDDVSGFVGNFIAKVSTPAGPREIPHGAVIIATGGREHRPSEYLYGQHPRVVTLTELEEGMATGRLDPANGRAMAFIQCVGSREPDRPYCSRVCCAHSVKLALEAKAKNPGLNVFILYRDMRTYGLEEDSYKKARDEGVIFIRYDPDRKPRVEMASNGSSGKVRVLVDDHVLGRPLSLEVDWLALATATEPADHARLSQLYKVPLTADGFFLEAHVKLRPVDFATDGVFVCGLAHSPKTIAESITQAQAAAGRAVTILSRRQIEAPGRVAEVDRARCVACGTCESLCAAKAIAVDAEKNVAVVNEALCKGCGVCASSCRSGAVSIRGFTDTQIASMIDAAVGG